MTYELPTTNVVCLYSVENAADPVVTSRIYQYFETKEGYSVDYDPNVNIAKLKHLNKDCSVLFLNTPGIANPGSNSLDALQSGTHDLSEINNAVLRKELQQDKDSGLIRETDSGHLAITFELIRQNWRFLRDSFVFINGCTSFDDTLPQGSLSAILKKDCHAGVVGGWAQYSTPAVGYGITYLFDRLLGTTDRSDDPRKEVPPQRPFDWVSIFQKMKSLGLDTLPVISQNGEKTHPMQMRIEPNGMSDLGLLVPSIAYLDFDDEKKKLTLTGMFGTVQGEVHIGTAAEGKNNKPVVIDSWLPDTIQCTVENDRAGRVTVQVNRIESNPRFLTEWRGDTVYECSFNKPEVSGNVTGNLVLTVNTQLHFRADVGDYREEPGENPLFRDQLRVTCADDSVCTWKAKGKICTMQPFAHNNFLFSEEWDASGSEKVVPSNGMPGQHRRFYMIVGLKPEYRMLPVEYDLQATKAFMAKMEGNQIIGTDNARSVQLHIPPGWYQGKQDYRMVNYDEEYTIPALEKADEEFSEPPFFPWVPEPPVFLPKYTAKFSRKAFPATDGTTPPEDAAR